MPRRRHPLYLNRIRTAYVFDCGGPTRTRHVGVYPKLLCAVPFTPVAESAAGAGAEQRERLARGDHARKRLEVSPCFSSHADDAQRAGAD